MRRRAILLLAAMAVALFSVEGVGLKPKPTKPTTSLNLTFLQTYSKFRPCQPSLPISRQETVLRARHRFLN
jgi:hypothetical protein